MIKWHRNRLLHVVGVFKLGVCGKLKWMSTFCAAWFLDDKQQMNSFGYITSNDKLTWMKAGIFLDYKRLFCKENLYIETLSFQFQGRVEAVFEKSWNIHFNSKLTSFSREDTKTLYRFLLLKSFHPAKSGYNISWRHELIALIRVPLACLPFLCVNLHID